MDNEHETRILIVEDERPAAAVLEKLVEKELAATFTTVRDCAAAREQLASGEFDVVLLDYRLPDGDGLALLQEITALDVSPAAIIVTGRGDEQRAAEAFRLGAAGYVIKDGNLSVLLPRAVNDAVARNTLKSSDRLVQSLLENTDVAFSVVDRDGRILYMSPSTEKVSGFTVEEMRSRAVFDYVHPDDRSRILATFSEAVDLPGASMSAEYRVLHRDGTWRTVECHGQNLIDDPDVGGVLLTAKDVTRRKETEEALRQSREMYRMLLETTHDSFVLTDIHGTILDVSQRALELHGFDSAAELLGKNLWALVVPEERSRVERDFERLKQARVTAGQGMEYTILKKDGTTFIGEIRFAVIPGDGIRPGIIMVAATDITERRRAENALRESEARYREVFEDTPTAIWENDCSGVKRLLDGYRKSGVRDFDAFFTEHPEEILRLFDGVTVVDVNQAAVTMFEGQGKEELVERFREIFTVETLESLKEGLEVGAREETIFQTDTVARTLKGKLLRLSVRATIAPGYESTWSRILFCILDIGDLRRAEEKLRQINAELEAYAHTVSHDLKGPLTAILGYGDILKIAALEVGETKLRERITGYVDGLEMSARRCFRLIEDLLKLAEAGQTAGAVEDVEVAPVVERVAREWQAEIEAKGIEVAVGDGLGHVRANPTHVYQLFSNLINNAITYCDAEAPVVEVLRLDADEEGTSVFLVRDNGRGLPTDAVEDIFLPFTKGRGGGTGIGLYIVAKIVETYGGEINAYSDNGACFQFSLRDAAT